MVMKKIKFLILTLLLSAHGHSEVSIHKNTFFSAKNASISIKNTDVNMLSTAIKFDTNTTLAVQGGSGGNALFCENQALFIPNLKVSGNLELLGFDTLYVSEITWGDKALFDIADVQVKLLQNMQDETDSRYLTSTGRGALIKDVQCYENTTVQSGMGLDIIPSESKPLRITRTHTPVSYKNSMGASIIYSLSDPTHLAKIEMGYITPILNGIETPLVYSLTEKENEWVMNENIRRQSSTKKLSALGLEQTQKITIITYPQLEFPKYMRQSTPVFEIIGNEQFPESRLVVLSRNGSVVEDISPYLNAPLGGNYGESTYYYMYYTNKQNKEPLKKGFFEVVQ